MQNDLDPKGLLASMAEFVTHRGNGSYSVMGEHVAQCALDAIAEAGYRVVSADGEGELVERLRKEALDTDNTRPDSRIARMATLLLEAASRLSQAGVRDSHKFKLGHRVTKTKGSSWTGRVVGFYSTELTPVGYAVESENEPGSVQIYPEAALSGDTP